MTFKPKADKTYFIPLGGVGEVGGNAYLYATGGKYLLIDCGINFPDESMPGVDILLPDITFAEKNRDKLLGVLITHGHEDHIGALPILWKRLQVPVYATGFAFDLLSRKFDEAGLSRKVDLIEYNPIEELRLGDFSMRFVPMAHSIPDTYGVHITTPQVKIFHTADWKIDHHPLIGHETDEEMIKTLDVDILIGDSTNAHKPEDNRSEKIVRDEFFKLLPTLTGAVAVTLFSSNIARVDTILKAAAKAGRDVCLLGRSLIQNIQTAVTTGLLNPSVHFIPEKEASQLPRRRILYLCTGCQGEAESALSRIATGQHRSVRLNQGDNVIFSSMDIPGNERAILTLHNFFARSGVRVLDTQSHPDIHVSGHPNAPSLVKMMEWCKPQALIPMHGEDYHLSAHAELARVQGIESFIPHNGAVLELLKKQVKHIADLEVQAHGLDETGELRIGGEAIRERKKMAYAGSVVAIVLQNIKNHSFLGVPQVRIMGLYDTESDRADLENQCVRDLKNELSKLKKNDLKNSDIVTEETRRTLRQTIKRLTGKKPLIEVMHQWVS